MEALRRGFAQADPRYGPVPLWWWSGEPVTEERLRWQLQRLRHAGLRNVCVINLAPAGPTYGCGADEPAFYSPRWWELFACALDEAERLGMYVWFYDQIGFSGANFPARLAAENPEWAGYQLRRFEGAQPLPAGAEVLGQEDGATYAVLRQGFDWLNPRAAGALLDRIHGEMERRFPDRLGRVLAGSFQDELQPMPTWTAAVPAAYKDRYGEDLLARLPLLFGNGPEAADVRRRFYRLLAELAEEAFFRPLGEWHARHRMLLGCDQAGPGREVDPHGAQRLYLDYFRTHRHFSAPGSDMDGEAKPHASLVHTWGGDGRSLDVRGERPLPRVWLEGFHSSGWGGTVEETLHWLVPWLQAGVTLFDPHAVYYSTRGGWWEWAPPDTGWRQPYGEHYPIFADAVARVCRLLAQGHHRCNLAVYYPGQAVWGHMSLGDLQGGEHPQAAARRDPDAEVQRIRQTYWALVGRQARHQANLGVLRGDRRDFDVLDDLALARAAVSGKAIRVGEEAYAALILPAALPPEPTARERLQAFAAAGGLVVAVGVPDGSGLPDGAIRVGSPEEVPQALAGLPRYAEGPGLALARRVDDVDVFLLLPPMETLLPMHQAAAAPPPLPEKATVRLRTEGVPEYWDPVTGQCQPLPYIRDGAWVQVDVPFTDWPAALVVCGPGEGARAEPGTQVAADSVGCPPDPMLQGLTPVPARTWRGGDKGTARTLPQDGWRVRVVPTLDNRFGDFDLHGGPPTGTPPKGLMPVERRLLRVRTELHAGEGQAAGWHRADYDDREWPQRLWSEGARWLVHRGERWDRAAAMPLVYSTRLGAMAFRDWAGRMGRVPRAFLHLGRMGRGEIAWLWSQAMVPTGGRYWLQLESPGLLAAWIDGQQVVAEDPAGWQAVVGAAELQPGPHEVLIRFAAVRDGISALGAQLTASPPESLPQWLQAPEPGGPARDRRLQLRVAQAQPASSVQAHFAVHGAVQLWVNGHLVAVDGDFNPYVRSGQQRLDLTAFWRHGDNVLEVRFPEGRGDERVFLDGQVSLQDGGCVNWCTGPEWVDAAGRPAPAAAHAGSTEALWIRPRPHPLPDVGWLMPDAVPLSPPVPFLLDPEEARRPVWFRFPLPSGARALWLAAAGTARVWVGGQEVSCTGGWAEFPPQPAGTVCAVRVVPDAPAPEAAVLTAPMRLETGPVPGRLGDWRTVLHLPHHSGAVEYETEVQGSGPRALLDLGFVRGTAEVWVDGRPAGVRLWHPYRFDLQGSWGAGRHRLRIRVTNTLGPHYEIGRPTILVREGQGLSGLFGPVTLREDTR